MDEKWTLTDLNIRLDKLEQEIQWTRDMIDIIQEDMDATKIMRVYENNAFVKKVSLIASR